MIRKGLLLWLAALVLQPLAKIHLFGVILGFPLITGQLHPASGPGREYYRASWQMWLRTPFVGVVLTTIGLWMIWWALRRANRAPRA